MEFSTSLVRHSLPAVAAQSLAMDVVICGYVQFTCKGVVYSLHLQLFVIVTPGGWESGVYFYGKPKMCTTCNIIHTHCLCVADDVRQLLQELDSDLLKYLQHLHIGDMTFCHR